MIENTTWRGKSVLITGGSGGIGRAIARRFAADGADLVLCDVNADALADLAREIGPAQAHPIVTDISRVSECAQAIGQAVTLTGRLDLLINGAGVWTEGPSEMATEEQWDRVVGVNLKGAFFMSRYAIPHLEKTGGAIISISSDAGVMGDKGAAIYCASKGGLNLLTKSLACELAPRGVRVNAVCPCDVQTPMIEYQAQEFGGGDPDGYKRALLSAYPQGDRARFAHPDEIAAFVHFIASPQAAPITGACLAIDFGLTAGA